MAKTISPRKASTPLPDEWLLRTICTWKVSRAQQLIAWAEHDLATVGGTRGGVPMVNTDALKEMKQAEELLAGFAPETVLGANELLDVCLDILAIQKRDPDITFAQGPVLEIIRYVRSAVGWLHPMRPLGKENLAPTTA